MMGAGRFDSCRRSLARLGVKRIATHLTPAEQEVLFALARALPSGAVVVEIGSYLGASTACLAAGARESGGRVHAVDTWTNRAMTEGERDTFAEFGGNTAPLAAWIQPHRGESVAVAASFAPAVDLLFVDGDHSYAGVAADLAAWLPKIKPGGWIVFHDYGWAEGVRRAVREQVAPRQIEGGRRRDTLYWTRIAPRAAEPSLAVSVIVPTCDRAASLARTLETLDRQAVPAGGGEIIVVDNRPNDAVRQQVEAAQADTPWSIRYLAEKRPGLHQARHAGARQARGAVLVYVDDDVDAPDGWLAALLSPFADPLVAVVGGKVTPGYEQPPPSFVQELSPDNLSLLDLGAAPLALSWPRIAFGCNLAIRRDVLFEAGGFHPDAMGERRDLWQRGDGENGLQQAVYELGYRIVYEPRAALVHRIPAARLQPEYFCRRQFQQGLSDSYRQIRARPARFRLPLFALFYLGLSLAVWRPRNVAARAAGRYWLGRGLHQARALLQPVLYRHIRQDTYLLSE